MLLDKILTPRWKHKNPQVRKRALQSLNPHKDESQKIYQEVLTSDPELFIRRIAIQGLNNVSELQKLRQSEQLSEIYEEATKRLCELLATSNKHRPVSFLKNTLSTISENRILEYVALHANEAELQLLALDKVANESILLELLNTAQFSKNKKHALDKLTSVNSLKRAIKILKRKDKDLASYAQEKLDALLQQSKQSTDLQKETRRTANELLELINLCKFSGEWQKYQLKCQQLHDRFNQMLTDLNTQQVDSVNLLSKEVAEAFDLFKAKLVELNESNVQQSGWTEVPAGQENVSRPTAFTEFSEIIKQVDSCLSQAMLTDATASNADEEAAHARLNEIEQNWNKVDASLKNVVLSDEYSAELIQLQSEFTEKSKQLQHQLKAIQQVSDYLSRIETLNSQASILLESEDKFDPDKASQLIKKYQRVNTPDNSLVPPAVLSNTQQLIKALNLRVSEVESDYEKLCDEFLLLVDHLGQALASGKAKSVKQHINRGRNILKQLPRKYVTRLDKKGLQKKFKALVRDADSLLGWQQWSSSSAREKLIEAMEKLALITEENSENEDFDFSAVAAEINKARHQWKQASAGVGNRDEQLWEKFDAACNKAYQPCKNYFDKLGEERNRNLKTRVEICQDLEKYVDTVSEKSFDEIDWRAIEKIIHVAHQDWGKLGVVNRGEREKINKRFHAAIHQLEKLVKNRREDNKNEKQQLISRVETVLNQLQDNTIELASAIDSVKKSQAQWKDIGPARKDKQLWEKFRAVCDAVFEFRNAEQKKIKQQQAVIDDQRQQILKKIEDCTELQGEELLHARAQLDQLQSEWRSLSKLKKGHKLERRFTELCQKFYSNIKKLHEYRSRESKQLLQQNVATCYRLEKLIESYFQGASSDSALQQELDELEKHWNPVEEKSLNFSESIGQRFQSLKSTVLRLIDGEGEPVKQQIAEQKDSIINCKQDLCIKMEILAGKESPEGSRQRRMELQVSQLAENMKQSGSPNIEKETHRLISQWHTSGFILPPESFDFERRFYSALESLDKDYQYPL